MADRRAPSHHLRAAHCPHCGHQLMAASSVTGTRAPADGDASICGECRGLGVFVVGPLGVAIRLPTPAEEAHYRSDPWVKRALAAMAESYDSWTAADLAHGADDG